MSVPSGSTNRSTPVIYSMQNAELDDVAKVFAKAFYQDPNTAYFFGLERQLSHAGNITRSSELGLLRRIRWYHRVLVDMIHSGGGEVDVLVTPAEGGELGHIAGTATWLNPGGDADLSVMKLLFSGILIGLLRSLGPGGLSL